MRKWKRNWMIKRMVLGFAVAALLVPAVAQARVDSGLGYQPNSNSEVSKVATSNVKVSTPVGLPNAGLNDYLKARDGIEIARLQPRDNRASDVIENVRLAPRTVSTPQVVSSPGFNWGDAGIGAGLILGLVLLGGAAFYGTRHLGKAQTA